MKRLSLSFLKNMMTIIVTLPFLYIWFDYYEPITMTAKSKQVTTLMIVLYVAVFYYLARRLDGFRISINRIRELIFSQIIAVGMTDFFAAIMIWMLSIHFPNLLPGLVCFAVQCALIIPGCYYSHKLFFRWNSPKTAAVIYGERHGMEELISAYGLEKRYSICGSFTVEEVISESDTECRQNLDERLTGIEDVFICGVHSRERNVILKYCVAHGIRVSMVPRVGDVVMSSAHRMHMLHLPFLRVSRYDVPLEYRLMKRLADVVISGIALIVLSPLMAILALLIRRDGGPALYKQVRLTKDARQFKILKFRSMCVDAEKYSGAVLSAGENDPRITKIGRFIRACRLDELPQLWNIFIGEMSIVGPRPERPELAAKIEEELPEFALRLQCKAGLTGYAQVYGKYNTTPYDKTLMDLMYIAHPSLLEDLTIMLATVKILFSKESTEGVGEAVAELVYKPRQSEDI